LPEAALLLFAGTRALRQLTTHERHVSPQRIELIGKGRRHLHSMNSFLDKIESSKEILVFRRIYAAEHFSLKS
jgi:hypothetical protein